MGKRLEKFYNLVEAFEALPTIGKKSALRLAYNIVHKNSFAGIKLANAIEEAISSIKKCIYCNGLSEDEICDICKDEHRDKDSLCIVQSAKDIFIIEESHQYKGLYCVIDSVNEANIKHLLDLVSLRGVVNIFFAITPSIENEAFILHIEDVLKDFNIKFSKIAHGIPTGISLENIDSFTLSRAIDGKVVV